MAGQRGGLPLSLLLLSLAGLAVPDFALGKGRAGCDALCGAGGERGASLPGVVGCFTRSRRLWGAGGKTLWVLFAVCYIGSRGGRTAPPLCEDGALQGRHPPGHGLGSDLCPSPHYYLTSCCLQQLKEGTAARGFGSFWWGWLKAAGSLRLSSPPPCEQSPRLTGFVLGSLGNPAWHLKATALQALLDGGPGSQAVLCILLERVTDVQASPGTARCPGTGSVGAERTALTRPSTPLQSFRGSLHVSNDPP